MLCDECKQNQATVKVIVVIDGTRIERHLCATCMAQQKIQLQAQAEGLRGMLSAIWRDTGKTSAKRLDLTCSRCGTTYDAFAKTTRLGCAQCYQDFQKQLHPLFLQLHGRARHVGRIPQRVDPAIKTRSHTERLQREMAIAVACEDFEQAAVLRDELRALTAAAKGGAVSV